MNQSIYIPLPIPSPPPPKKNRFWVYQTIIMNASVGYAFYCLGLFYILLHTPLEPYNPVPKFLCIKAVLFLSFWQGVVIAGLVRFVYMYMWVGVGVPPTYMATRARCDNTHPGVSPFITQNPKKTKTHTHPKHTYNTSNTTKKHAHTHQNDTHKHNQILSNTQTHKHITQ